MNVKPPIFKYLLDAPNKWDKAGISLVEPNPFFDQSKKEENDEDINRDTEQKTTIDFDSIATKDVLTLGLEGNELEKITTVREINTEKKINSVSEEKGENDSLMDVETMLNTSNSNQLTNSLLPSTSSTSTQEEEQITREEEQNKTTTISVLQTIPPDVGIDPLKLFIILSLLRIFFRKCCQTLLIDKEIQPDKFLSMLLCEFPQNDYLYLANCVNNHKPFFKNFNEGKLKQQVIQEQFQKIMSGYCNQFGEAFTTELEKFKKSPCEKTDKKFDVLLVLLGINLFEEELDGTFTCNEENKGLALVGVAFTCLNMLLGGRLNVRIPKGQGNSPKKKPTAKKKKKKNQINSHSQKSPFSPKLKRASSGKTSISINLLLFLCCTSSLII